MIDASKKGNISRFFNHSCDPNMEVKIFRNVYCFPSVQFFSKRDIKYGEELTFDYFSNILCNQIPNLSEVACFCGSINCRKFLPK